MPKIQNFYSKYQIQAIKIIKLYIHMLKIPTEAWKESKEVWVEYFKIFTRFLVGKWILIAHSSQVTTNGQRWIRVIDLFFTWIL